jgi:hypothetical protein
VALAARLAPKSSTMVLLGTEAAPEVKTWVKLGVVPVVVGGPINRRSQCPKPTSLMGSVTSPSTLTSPGMGSVGFLPVPMLRKRTGSRSRRGSRLAEKKPSWS